MFSSTETKVLHHCQLFLVLSLFLSAFHAASGQQQQQRRKAQTIQQLPSYVGKGCSRNDPNINECVVRVGAPAIRRVVAGDPKYKIPQLDPLLLKEIKVQQGTRSVGLSLYGKDCKLYGLSNTKFVRASVDWDKRQCDWFLTLDKMRIEGKYNVSGQVLLLPIIGSGNMLMNLRDLEFNYKYDWSYETRDNGLEYVVIGNSSFPFEVGSMTLQLENLFNGDKLLGENMNRFLNENWRDIMRDLKPALTKAFANIAKSILQNMANVVPFDVMFPKKYPL